LTIERIWSAVETTLFNYSGDSTTGQVCLKKEIKNVNLTVKPDRVLLSILNKNINKTNKKE